MSTATPKPLRIATPKPKRIVKPKPKRIAMPLPKYKPSLPGTGPKKPV